MDREGRRIRASYRADYVCESSFLLRKVSQVASSSISREQSIGHAQPVTLRVAAGHFGKALLKILASIALKNLAANQTSY